MKATSTAINQSYAGVEKNWPAILMELTKARLTALVLLTTMVGFYLGTGTNLNVGLLFNSLLGTGAVAAGAAALNQLMEREFDARMPRTASRPLPQEQVSPEWVLGLGLGAALLGTAWLSWFVNPTTALLGAVTLLCYLFIYTPLKRVTEFNTMVGAIPGAIPPLMGWTAATGGFAPEGWALFAILFFWQIPHFLAIAWMYRDEYEQAGFVMLPAVDTGGHRTGYHAVSHTLGLILVSLLPVALGLNGWIYGTGALVIGGAFLRSSLRFANTKNRTRARSLFLMSIIYLPLLLILLMVDKL